MASVPVTIEQDHRALNSAPIPVRCLGCGRRFTALTLTPTCCPGALVTSDYQHPLRPIRGRKGMWRFLDWLPSQEAGPLDVGAVTYRSRGLARALGLDELWISANGYAPEVGGACPSASFKDLEAAPTLQLLTELGVEGVVVASAGNTARAFAHLASELGFPALIVVAESHLDRVWNTGGPFQPCVQVVGIAGGTYASASRVAAEVAPRLGWATEGGARNVARRDGIGTLLLDAAATAGHLPRHYVQAVGGGAGPIACFEAAQRLIASGTAAGPPPVFHMVQNAAYRPVDRAWSEGRDRLHSADLHATGPIFTDILVSAAPVYTDRGGLHDVLSQTGGHTYSVEPEAAASASAMLLREEGIDAHPAAAVALAGLRQAVAARTIPTDEPVLLAVTGMGEAQLMRDRGRHPARPMLVTPAEIATDEIVRRLGDRDGSQAARSGTAVRPLPSV